MKDVLQVDSLPACPRIQILGALTQVLRQGDLGEDTEVRRVEEA